MTETLDRDELIGLLNSLGSEDDAEALAAARRAQALVAGAGVSWDELLVPEESAEEDRELDEEPTEAEEEPTEAEEEPAEAEEEPPAEAAEKNAESLALIGKLLARKDISQELREELEGYKADIAEGDFTEADRTYLRAVSQRLKK